MLIDLELYGQIQIQVPKLYTYNETITVYIRMYIKTC